MNHDHHPSDTNRSRNAPPLRRRRALRIVALVVGVLVGLVLLLVLALLAPPVRSTLLSTALDRLPALLPGHLEIGSAKWPSLDHLVLDDIVWTSTDAAEADTLASLSRLEVQVDLFDLSRGDIHVPLLVALGIRADLPRIQKATASPSPDRTDASQPSTFPRAGSIAPLPSVAIDSLQLKILHAVLDDSLIARGLEATGHWESRHAHAVSASLEISGALDSPDSLRVLRLDHLALRAALPGSATLEAQGVWAHRFDVEVTGDAGFGRDRGRWGVRLDVRHESSGSSFASVHADADPVYPADRSSSESGSIPAFADLLPSRLRGTLEFSTPPVRDLGAVPGVSVPATAPDLGSLRGRLEYDAASTFASADLALRIEPNEWFRELRVLGSFDEEHLQLDSLEVELPGLRVQGRGIATRGPDSNGRIGSPESWESATLEFDLTAVVNGTQWANRFDLEISDLEEIDARIDLSAHGPAREPALSLQAHGSLTAGSNRVDPFDLRLDAPADSNGPAWVSAVVHTPEARARLSAEVQVMPHRYAPKELRARLGPIELLRAAPRAAAQVPARPSADTRSRITTTWDPLRVEANGVQVIGDAGNATLSGTWASVGGDIELEIAWPRVPDLLVDLMGGSPAMRDSLQRHWNAAEHTFAYGIDASSHIEMSASSPRVDARGSVVLPGPNTLAPVFLDAATAERFGTWGAVRGSFDAHYASDGSRAMLRLDDTEWIERALIDVRVLGDRVDLDSLDLSLESLTLRGRGRATGDSLDLDFEGSLTDGRILDRLFGTGRFAPGADSVAANADFTVQLDGPSAAPQADVQLQGTYRDDRFDIPVVQATLHLGDGLIARIDAPEGATLPEFQLDTATIRFDSGKSADSASVAGGTATPDTTAIPMLQRILPGSLSIAAAGPQTSLTHRLHMAQIDSIWILRSDRLEVEYENNHISNLGTIAIDLRTNPLELAVQDLRMQGSIGELEARGILGSDSTHFFASSQLRLPEEPWLRNWPKDVWPSAIELDLEAISSMGGFGDSLAVSAIVEGMQMPGDVGLEDAALELRVFGNRSGLRSTLLVSTASDSFLTAQAALPGILDVYPPKLQIDADSDLDVAATFEGFPVPLTSAAFDAERFWSSEAARLTGSMNVRGTLRAPMARLDLDATVPQSEALSGYRLTVAATADSSDLLQADVIFRKDERAFMEAHAETRLGPSSRRLGDVPVPALRDSSIVATVRAKRLNLDDLDPLMPPDLEVKGILDLDAEARGRVDNPEVDGSIGVKDFTVRTADGSWASGQVDVTFSGTKERPTAEGRVVIEAGVIRLPEESKELLPRAGNPLLYDALWSDSTRAGMIAHALPADSAEAVAELGAPRDSTAAVESTATSEVMMGPPETAARRGLVEARRRAAARQRRNVPELDVNVTIPSGLWIRGRGLDAELAGNLRLEQRETLLPTLAGELEALRGTFVFLGRTFDLEVGRVAFYGEDELNPSLDIRLSTYVKDTRIRIVVTGTALDPDLVLSSEPPLPEGDIFSLLLFGTISTELDTGQADLLASRASEIATTFANAQLGQRISRELGVDMFSVQSGTGPEARQALIVGKYLSRKILLQYEQALEEAGDIFVNIEYLLSQRLKLETHFGLDDQSGVEINWGLDY